ncbi:VOC family protein [Cohnella panacarvi]|uniref:VOC family protein n=1 Tax=Cohnella panacarvi TaxID=400776 RepID=UPI0004795D0A|nr:VOC family protein [Cohnella panacarvi]
MALKSTTACVNLHVENVEQSMAFFAEIGFEFDFADKEKAARFVIGDNMLAMLLADDYFKLITKKEPVDTDQYAQMTIALAFESRDKVDETVNKAVSLGGKSLGEPEDYGFMYQWAFQDLDGHIWAISHMNRDAI